MTNSKTTSLYAKHGEEEPKKLLIPLKREGLSASSFSEL